MQEIWTNVRQCRTWVKIMRWSVVVTIFVVATLIAGCGDSATIVKPPQTLGATGALIANPTRPTVSVTAQQTALRRFEKLGKPIYCGGGLPYAALTFDDGPGPLSSHVISRLRRAGLTATFFLVGRNVGDHVSLVQAERQLGALGDHSWDHAMLTSLPYPAIDNEYHSTKQAIAAAGGGQVALVRPPYGARNDLVAKAAHHNGLIEILWTVDSEDALGADARQIGKNVAAGLGPGAIILMHDNRGQTVKALWKYIIPRLRRKKITLVTLPELLALNPPSAQQLADGPKGCKRHGEVNVSGDGASY